MYCQHRSVSGQCQKGIVHITGDMEDALDLSCFPFEVDQVEEDVQDSSAGIGQEDLLDMNLGIGPTGFGCQCIKDLFDAEEGGMGFAVYEGQLQRTAIVP